MTVIDFFVAGEPMSQGGMRAVPTKKGARLISSGSTGLRYWRERVASEAQRAATSLEAGPVMVVACFFMPRPKSRPQKDRWPDRQPDIDKLARAVLDSVTNTLVEDDKQVCGALLFKTYAEAGQQPGVRVVMRPLWADEAAFPYATAVALLDYTRGRSQTLEGVKP